MNANRTYGIEIESVCDISLTILDKNTETLYLARNYAKPLYVVNLRKQLGIRAWASTPEIMLYALKAVKLDPSKIKGFSTMAGHVYTLHTNDPALKLEKLFQFNPGANPSMFWPTTKGITDRYDKGGDNEINPAHLATDYD